MADDEHLEPPHKTSIEDPGAHDLESSESEDHFSDAQSGLDAPSGDEAAPTIPHTRVEKVDDEPSYGEEPGTEAYRMREKDAAPDEIEIIPEHQQSASASATSSPAPTAQKIPTTVVEKIDPDTPSHGDVPGTVAHEKRAADAVPDLVVKAGDRSRSSSTARSRSGSTPGDLPIPITKVERVDSSLGHGEVPGTAAYEMRAKDAEPDIVEEVDDVPGMHIPGAETELASPTLPSSRSQILSHARRKSSAAGKKAAETSVTTEYDEAEDGQDEGFGDDFDDFEEGEEDAEFGDFDDGFQEAAPAATHSRPFSLTPSFPVLDFSDLDTLSDIETASEPYLNALFPQDTIDTSCLPPLPASSNPIFQTPRSASLWSQLVAPPPLQPPNWIRSRIRRLFLVSLGVPVDLDEILPASKQKKLILPSINFASGSSSSPRNSSSISRLKQQNGSSTSVDSQGNANTKRSNSQSRRRKGPPPAPQLDLVWARQLCEVTDEAMAGFTPEEMKEHVKVLEGLKGTANEVLEYWTRRTDEKLGDREAFEGVIENLVKHARKTRK